MKEYNLEGFERGLFELGITLSEEQKTQFLQYYELLVEWNSFMNLTAITEFDQVITKHFLDSLSLVKVCDVAQPDYRRRIRFRQGSDRTRWSPYQL